MDKLKLALATVGGVFATLTEQYALIFACVVIVIVFDVVTGLIQSKVTGVPWNSKKGAIGFWKKLGLLAALFFGVFMDYFIPVALGVVSISLPFNCPFGLIIGVYIVLNESISICENLYHINSQAVPSWVIRLLKNTSDKLNQTNENDAHSDETHSDETHSDGDHNYSDADKEDK